MIAGIFETPFGQFSICCHGTPTPEQVRDFLPEFETALNAAVAEFQRVTKEENIAKSN